MKRGASYLPQDSAFPSEGIDVLSPPTMIQNGASPALVNFSVVKGLLQKRLGYWRLAGVSGEEILGIVEFESLAGTKTLLVFGTEKQYKLDMSGTPSLVDITGSAADDTGWTGDEIDFLDYVITTGLDGTGTLTKWIIATNGADGAIYWDGVNSTFKPYPALFTDLDTFRAIRMFFNKVVVANITTSTHYGQLIAWTDTQSLMDFQGTLAGEIVVPGVDGDFLRAEQLGDRLVLYSNNSIAVMTYVGGSAIFSVELVREESRLVSGRCVVNLGAVHLFLSQENIIMFDGSRLTRNLGDKIFRQYREELAVSRLEEAFAFHDAARQQVYFTIPVGDDDHAIYVLDYDLTNFEASKWTRQEYSTRPRAMGVWSRTSDLTFDGAFATSTAANIAIFPANQGSTKEGFPVRMIADVTSLYVADDTVSTDNATSITAYWDSKDFTVPVGFLAENARWLEIQLELFGGSAEILVSTDGGEGWESVASLTLQQGWRTYTIPVDYHSPKFRIRIQNNAQGGGLIFRWLRVQLRPGGPT